MTDCDEIRGVDRIPEVILVDQSPLGTTPRSNPVTYMKAFDPIRRLFAGVDLSRFRGYTASTFSFNVEGGRCELCRGEGFEKIEMQFPLGRLRHLLGMRRRPLPARGAGGHLPQPEHPRRARPHHRGGHEVPSATSPRSCAGCGRWRGWGLDYLRLGQPVTTLSGGESQRLKLGLPHRPGDPDRHAVHLRRAHHRAPLPRHPPAAVGAAGAHRPRPLGGGHRAQPRGHQVRGPHHRPGTRGRRRRR